MSTTPEEKPVEFTLSTAERARIDAVMDETTQRVLGCAHAPLERPPGPPRQMTGWYVNIPAPAALWSPEMTGRLESIVRLASINWPGYGHMIRQAGARRYTDGSMSLYFFIDNQ